jgi:hypothetical protein
MSGHREEWSSFALQLISRISSRIAPGDRRRIAATKMLPRNRLNLRLRKCSGVADRACTFSERAVVIAALSREEMQHRCICQAL